MRLSPPSTCMCAYMRTLLHTHAHTHKPALMHKQTQMQHGRWRCSAVVDSLPSMCRDLGLISSTTKKMCQGKHSKVCQIKVLSPEPDLFAFILIIIRVSVSPSFQTECFQSLMFLSIY